MSEAPKKKRKVFAFKIVMEKGTDVVTKTNSITKAVKEKPTSLNSEVIRILPKRDIVILRSRLVNGEYVWVWRSEKEMAHTDPTNSLQLSVESNKKQYSKRHLACIKLLENHAAETKNKEQFNFSKELTMLAKLNYMQFCKHFDAEFANAQFGEQALSVLSLYVKQCKYKAEEYRRNNPNVVVQCEQCGYCKKPHVSRVKVDIGRVPYIVCCNTNKRVVVELERKSVDTHSLHSLRDLLYGTVFTIVKGNAEDIINLKNLIIHHS